MKKAIETKIAKNGTKMYYVEGKRVSREIANQTAAENREENFTVEYRGYDSKLGRIADKVITDKKMRVEVRQEAGRHDMKFYIVINGENVNCFFGRKTCDWLIRDAKKNANEFAGKILEAYINGEAGVKLVADEVIVINNEVAPTEYAISQEAMEVATNAETELANAEASEVEEKPQEKLKMKKAIETKIAKNGAKMYYVDGKRVSRKIAEEIESKQAIERRNNLVENTFAEYEKKSSALVVTAGYQANIVICFDGYLDFTYTRNYSTCEDAINAVNFFKTNFYHGSDGKFETGNVTREVEAERNGIAYSRVLHYYMIDAADSEGKFLKDFEAPTEANAETELANNEAQTSTPIINIADYNTMMTWAEKISNGQRDAVTPIVTYLSKLGYTADKQDVFNAIDTDDLNGFRRYISQFHFLVKDDAGYIQKLYVQEDGQVVLAEIPTCEYPSTENNTAETIEQTIGHKGKTQMANNLPTGLIEVANGADAFALVAPYFPNGLTFKSTGKGFNHETIFSFADKNNDELWLNVCSTADDKRIECVEVLNTHENGSKRHPLTVAIVANGKDYYKESVELADKIRRDAQPCDDNDDVFNLIPNFDGDDDTDDELIDPPTDKEPFTLKEEVDIINHNINWAKDTLATMTGDTYTDNIGETFTRNQLKQFIADWQAEIADLQPQADKPAEPPKPVELVAPTVMSALETINAMFPLDGFVEDVSKPNFKSAVNGDWRLNIFIDKNGTPEAVSLAEDDQLFLSVKIKAGSLRDSINRAIKTCVKNRIAYRKKHNAEMEKYEYELMHLLQAARRELEVA